MPTPGNPATLHIIEPTLFDETGHAYRYVDNICNANNALDIPFTIYIWRDRRNKKLFDYAHCHDKPFFFRRIRQLQKPFLYRKLLKQQNSNILISTANFLDLVILRYLAQKSTANIFTNFHQLNVTEEKITALQQIAHLIPHIHIFTTTRELAEIFLENHFTSCNVLPCPTAPLIRKTFGKPHFKKVLYAGAARDDKGFPDVVQLLKYFIEKSDDTMFEIQISPPHSGKFDSNTQAALQELNELLPIKNLILHKTTLPQHEYQELFFQSVCLLLYKPEAYTSKFTGVALDALHAGCPIITLDGNWASDIVKKYRAGISLPAYDSKLVYQALAEIRQKYDYYAGSAYRIGEILSNKHDPKQTLYKIKELANN